MQIIAAPKKALRCQAVVNPLPATPIYNKRKLKIMRMTPRTCEVTSLSGFAVLLAGLDEVDCAEPMVGFEQLGNKI